MAELIRRGRIRFVLIVSVFVALAIMVGQASLSSQQATGAPDLSKVPHYFGPWPNWVNSPLTLPNATVTITPAAGDTTGGGATAVATVDPTGTNGIASLTITNPGSGYTAAPDVTIVGGDGLATASATISLGSVVTGFTNVVPGSGYSAFDVALSGGGATTDATAIASGGVGAIDITTPGLGYTFPTVDFDMPDSPDGVQAVGHVPSIANGDATDGLSPDGEILEVIIDNAGSGYLTAPGVTIRNGTIYDPVPFATAQGSPAEASTTMILTAVNVVDFGAGYTSAPTVAISDPVGAGAGAAADAVLELGAVTGLSVTFPGSGYLDKGIRKFVDQLPKPCYPSIAPGTPGGCPENDATAKYLPLAEPKQNLTNGILADEYVIGLVQYRANFSTDMPQGALVRGYVQLETADNTSFSEHFPLQNELVNGTKVDILDPNGVQYLGVTAPQYLGPIIPATKDKPVRITFRNLLPIGQDGDLFLPVDSTLMGSGKTPDPAMMNPDGTMIPPVNNSTVDDAVRNPECTAYPKPDSCFKDDRATLHLHGGVTPWISDGTPHQWITPAGENTSWPQGVSVREVPDMTGCLADDDGCQTFYYTNQQSARLMFYHDHAWGITRLNVYAGEAAGYLISDSTEKKLIDSGAIPGPADTLPLIVQDKTFVPSDAQMYDVKDGGGNIVSYGQDPTWDKDRWGGQGNFWFHHVYMPAQNPGDPSGMSSYGRWMYGPWFWPPASATVYGPIPNPYYDATCVLDDPATWTYQTDPFCEPQVIPGTPNISTGMEQFNDTPLVNGVAYPTVTLEPKTYRFRVLNAANDRFFNFQWYQADPTQGDGTTEVALNALELQQAQTDPNISPTPAKDATTQAGPDWVQIGTEGGFLPAPVVVDGQQPTTWITDPTRFDVGNVDLHSLLLAPAERADVIVDFSKYAGKTLILYNDAPAAFPARVPTYDYYTGAPDLSPNGAPTILPGYGPNTRTIMKVTIAGTPAPAFNLTKVRTAFSHKSNGSGAFESGQPPIIVGQQKYNSAYGSNFVASGNCNTAVNPAARCDGFVRVNDTETFGFNTLRKPTEKMSMGLQPKAIHDEMNATTFDEFGRMQATLGIEAQPPTPGLQNVTLYPFVNPQTELIDATNLPTHNVTFDVDGKAVEGVNISPISENSDGTQIWRITHNGVDTHPIHFHLYDVQVLNRVTWDNIIIPPDATELGWKDTVRMSPLEDTIVALRPIVPTLPWELPNSVRALNPMDPIGSTALFNNIDPQGNPSAPITNQLVNYGWEYVYHCHILTHEEMDMMRPVSVAYPPKKASGLAFSLDGVGAGQHVKVSFTDNSIAETSYQLQRKVGDEWTNVGTPIAPPLSPTNTAGDTLSIVDPTSDPGVAAQFRVVAKNQVGYVDGVAAPAGWQDITARSNSTATDYVPIPEITSINPVKGPQAGGTVVTITGLRFEPGATVTFGGSAATSITVNSATSITATTPAHAGGQVDVVVTNAGATPATLTNGFLYITTPSAPQTLTGVVNGSGSVRLTWTKPASDGGATINLYSCSVYAAQTGGSAIKSASTSSLGCTLSGLTAGTAWFTVRAQNSVGYGPYADRISVVVVVTPSASTPTVGSITSASAVISGTVNAGAGSTNVTIQCATNTGFTSGLVENASPSGSPATGTSATPVSGSCTGLAPGTGYFARIKVVNSVGTAYSATNATFTTPATVPTVPRNVAAVVNGPGSVRGTWTAPASNGGAAITLYSCSLYNALTGGTAVKGASTASLGCTMTGLSAGTYYFAVRAQNSVGYGPFNSPRVAVIVP